MIILIIFYNETGRNMAEHDSIYSTINFDFNKKPENTKDQFDPKILHFSLNCIFFG